MNLTRGSMLAIQDRRVTKAKEKYEAKNDEPAELPPDIKKEVDGLKEQVPC